MHSHTHTHAHTPTHIHLTHTNIYTHIHVIHTHTHTCTYAQTHTHKRRLFVASFPIFLNIMSVYRTLSMGFAVSVPTSPRYYDCPIFFSAPDKTSCLVTMDFSCAFDSINFDLLLVALRACGVSELACEWFASYLSNRSQCTKYFGTLSDPLLITSGVP